MKPTEVHSVQERIITYASEIGWTYVPRVESDKRRGDEMSYKSNLYYQDLLMAKLRLFNPWLPENYQLPHFAPRIEGNREMLLFLRNQSTAYDQVEKREKNVIVIDYAHPENNVFEVTYEFTVANVRYTNRQDIVFLINGIPVVDLECKNLTTDGGIEKAINDNIIRYHEETPELMTLEQLFAVSEGIRLEYGVSWNTLRRNIFAWKGGKVGELENKIKTFFDIPRILGLIGKYIMFIEKDEKLTKLVLREHQVQAVEAVLERSLHESGTRGLIWHTQGSGKTFTMIKTAELLFKSDDADKPTVIMMLDRNELVHAKGMQIMGEPMQEAKTAKIPGRSVFNQIVQMVEDGAVNSIVLLNPSRLSRNTVDTGRIIYLMDQGKLLEVVTPYQSFKNNPNDKFMLNLLCTQAKLENDNKSVNVKESLHLKAERGVFPGKARPGYKNNSEKPQGLRDISPHPVYFSLMRKLFDKALTGNYSIEALVREAGRLGIRSSKSGKPICKSWMHRLLRDPFYTGKFIYGGRMYQGSHKPLLTDDEFNLLQDIVEGRTKGRQQKHDFALNGIIECGECHYCVTAEKHVKKYKNGNTQEFGYYHCTKKGKHEGKSCNQAYLAISKLHDQFSSNISQIELMPEFAALALEALDEVKEQNISATRDSFEALQKALEGVTKRINNLVALKISPDNSDGMLLSDEEFADRKKALLIEKESITRQLSQINPNNLEWAEIGKESFEFGQLAAKRFEKEGTEGKRIIFKTLGSNPILLDQNLHFQLRYLFLRYKEGAETTKTNLKWLEPDNGSSNQSKVKNFLKSSVWCG